MLHRINTLEEDYRQQRGELEAKIKKLKAKSASFEAEIDNSRAASSGLREVNDLRRYLSTVSRQKEQKDSLCSLCLCGLLSQTARILFKVL